MALVFAFTSERATVDAVTVVAGNAELDTAYNNTLRVLQVLETTDVPVYKGADRPISRQLQTERTFFGPDNFGGASGKYPMAQVPAANKAAHIAMADMIKQRPGEYTLLLLGPLTNMATAILTEPRLTDNVARIFILGGNVFGNGNIKPASEFNFFTDPEAARVVLQRATCPVTVVTLEAMLQATVPWDVYNEVTAEDTKLAQFLRDINNHSVHCCLKNSPGFMLGDFLAVLAALVPDSVEDSNEGRVDVELRGEYTQGQMVHARLPRMLPHIGHNVTVVRSFNKDMVAEYFRKVFETDDE
ncbi:pyrimidine-specific ribonucleoside hydrolase RihA-like [Amblyomma americanum]